MSTAGCNHTIPAWEGTLKPIWLHPLPREGKLSLDQEAAIHWNEQDIKGKMKFSFIVSLILCPWGVMSLEGVERDPALPEEERFHCRL